MSLLVLFGFVLSRCSFSLSREHPHSWVLVHVLELRLTGRGIVFAFTSLDLGPEEDEPASDGKSERAEHNEEGESSWSVVMSFAEPVNPEPVAEGVEKERPGSKHRIEIGEL